LIGACFAGVVIGNDWKSAKLRQEYGKHFLGYLLKRIAQLEAQEAKSS